MHSVAITKEKCKQAATWSVVSSYKLKHSRPKLNDNIIRSYVSTSEETKNVDEHTSTLLEDRGLTEDKKSKAMHAYLERAQKYSKY